MLQVYIKFSSLSSVSSPYKIKIYVISLKNEILIPQILIVLQFIKLELKWNLTKYITNC